MHIGKLVAEGLKTKKQKIYEEGLLQLTNTKTYDIIKGMVAKPKRKGGAFEMQTKSRYEVISDLEQQKRELIRERDGLGDQLEVKEKILRDIVRNKADTAMLLDRKIEDAEEEIKSFNESMAEKKETIDALIVSVDESLTRFGAIAKTAKN